jgi:hypothetical protein
MRTTRQIACAEATRLISAGLDRELSGPARANLRLHFVVCAACRRFEQQMHMLRHALRGMRVGDGAEGAADAAHPAAEQVPPPAPDDPAR